MAIELLREVNDTGFEANYWYLMSISIVRGTSGADDMLTGGFALFKSEADFADKRAVSGENASVRVTGDVTGATTVTQMINALEAQAILAGEDLEGGTIV